MLKRIIKKLKNLNKNRLKQQCENEDLAKEILYYSKYTNEDEQNKRQKFLNKRIERRKNLYIYPEQVSV